MSKRSGMIARNILAVVVGLMGAVLVSTVASFIIVRSTYSSEDLARVREATPRSAAFERTMTEISDPFGRMQTFATASTLIVFPAAAIATGLIVGAIASTHPVVLATLASLPWPGILLVAGGLSARSLILGVAYPALAALSGWQAAQWRANRGGSHTPARRIHR